MEKIILVIVDNVPTLNIAIKKEETIGSLKELLHNSISNYSSYKIEMFLHPTAELKVWDTNMYDNLTLQSVWQSMENSSIVLTKSSSHKTLTGIKDVDLLILSQMDDKTLYNFCKVNKSARKLCSDENFWKNRLIQKYGQDAAKYKPEKKSWKKHYSFVHYAVFNTGYTSRIIYRIGEPSLLSTVHEDFYKVSYPRGTDELYRNLDKIIFVSDNLWGKGVYSIAPLEETQRVLYAIREKGKDTLGIVVFRIDDENDASISEGLLCALEYCRIFNDDYSDSDEDEEDEDENKIYHTNDVTFTYKSLDSESG